MKVRVAHQYTKFASINQKIRRIRLLGLSGSGWFVERCAAEEPLANAEEYTPDQLGH